MTITEYFAVVGSGLTDKDAVVIGPEVERLEREGRSTARGVRDSARDKKSPLHQYVFDCAKTEASDRYYLSRAGHLLRSIQVDITVVRTPGSEPVPHRMRAWYPVIVPGTEETDEPARERQYVSITKIQESPDLASQVWRDGLRRLQLFRAQFKDYDDIFAPVFRAVAEVEAKIEAAA